MARQKRSWTWMGSLLDGEDVAGDEASKDVITSNHSTGADDEQLRHSPSVAASGSGRSWGLTANVMAKTRKLSLSTNFLEATGESARIRKRIFA